MKKLLEAKDLEIYKRLLRILGEYVKTAPASGVDRLFNAVVEKGKGCMPKDKHALAILDKLLDEKSPADTIHKLMNMRFCNLCVPCKPMVKKGRKHEVAFWKQGDIVSDRVKDLIDWDQTGKSGSWTSIEGEKVQLIDMDKQEEK